MQIKRKEIPIKTLLVLSFKQKNHSKEWSGARDWNRTSTILRTADFESAASTNSATRAIDLGLQY
jgi:hypothetical protein